MLNSPLKLVKLAPFFPLSGIRPQMNTPLFPISEAIGLHRLPQMGLMTGNGNCCDVLCYVMKCLLFLCNNCDATVRAMHETLPSVAILLSVVYTK